MNTILLPDGTAIPKVGQGTWHLGEEPHKRASELEALQWGIENGLTLIDTAEMYGEGASEELVGEAIRPFQRDQLFLVSKVYPWNAGKNQIFDSCQNSLDRLGTDYLDLYLLHWRGSVPLRETVSCMEQLKAQGRACASFPANGRSRLLCCRRTQLHACAGFAGLRPGAGRHLCHPA